MTAEVENTTARYGSNIPLDMPATEDTPNTYTPQDRPMFDPGSFSAAGNNMMSAEEEHEFEQEAEREREARKDQSREAYFHSDPELSDEADANLVSNIISAGLDTFGIQGAKNAIIGGLRAAGEYTEDTFAEDAVHTAQDLVIALDRGTKVEHVGSWAERQMELQGYENDPTFDLSNLSEERKAYLYDGLSGTDIDGLGKKLDGAVSWQHAEAIREQYQTVTEYTEELQDQGILGMGARVAAAFTDPAALALGAATGSIGWASKGSRVVRALKGGVVTAGEAAALEQYMTNHDPHRTQEGVMYATAAGFGLGTGFSYLLGPRVALQDQLAGEDAVSRGAINPDRVPNNQRDLDLGDVDASRANPDDPYTRTTDFDDLKIRTPDEIQEARGNSGPIRASVDDVDSLIERARTERPPIDAAAFEPNIRGRLFGSPNDLVAWNAERLFPTLHGRGGKGPAPVNAMDRSTRLFRSAQVRVNKTFLNSFEDWKVETGNTGKTNLLERRGQYNQEVYRAVRGEIDSPSPAVQKAAAEIKATHADLVRRAERAGMEGLAMRQARRIFDDRPNAQGLRYADAELGRAGTAGLVRGAIINGSPELPADLASQLAEVYHALSRTRSSGSSFGTASPGDVFGDDMALAFGEAFAARRPGELDFNIGETIEALSQWRQANPEARLGLDTNHTVTSPTGNTVSMRSLLDDNAESAVEDSLRRTTGYIGMAEAGYKDPIKDFEDMLSAIDLSRQQYPTKTKGNILGRTKTHNLDEDMDAMRFIADMMVGGPQATMRGPLSQAQANNLRHWRQFQFSRVMGQSGFSQFADVGTAMGATGLKNFVEHIPAFGSILKRARVGDMSDELADELEAVLAPGMDKILDQPVSRFSSGEVDMQRATDTDKVLGHLNRGTSEISGMYLVQSFAERVGARAAAQRIAKQALGVKGQRKLSPKRLESMGLTPEWAERVFRELRTHTKWGKGMVTGRKLAALDLDNWTDIAARERFVDALHQFNRKAVQRNDPQDLAMWMHSDIGKTITQFQSFMYSAWSKQLLHGVRMHDMETFTMFALSTLTGGLGHVMRYTAMSAGRDDGESYRREHLSKEAIAKGSFYRSSWASFLPQIMDAGSQIAGADPSWTYGRMPSDILNNPSLGMADTAWSFATGGTSSIFDPDADMSERDWQNFTSLLPMQNAMGIQHALRAIVAD